MHTECVYFRLMIASNHKILFFSAWLLLGFWQSINTELLDDEALYWVYSRYPDWGYFEHPPMVSWLSRAGYAIMPHETGLRLFFLLLNTVSLILLQTLTNRKDPLLYYGIITGISLLQLSGHLAVPDSPFVFSAICFLIFFKRYLHKIDVINALLLTLAMAFAFYSKYHAILLVIFCFLANPVLFVRFHTWLVIVMTLLLMIPHFLWLSENDFGGIMHHLQERHRDAWRPSFTLQFLQSQFITTGPVTGWLLLYAALNLNTEKVFDRTLKWLMAGVFLFFFTLSFFVRVESNWTVLAFIPMILLSHQYLQNHRALRRLLLLALPFSLIFIFVNRVAMTTGNGWVNQLSRKELHDNKIFASRIKKTAADKPVVFIDSYQQASKYWFYSGRNSFSLNTINHYRNSYNLWPGEASIIGKTVCVVDSQDNRKAILQVIANYYSFSGIYFTITNIRRIGNSVEIQCSININKSLLPFIGQQPYMHLPVYLASYDHKGKLSSITPTNTKIGQLITGHGQMTIHSDQPLSLSAGKFRLAIETAVQNTYTCNSSFFTSR